MPAHWKIPDPEEGPIQAFAYDLRQLGAGKPPIAWIAEHRETQVSKAALYAALSGTRLPSHQTLGTLLRWWVGNPADEDPGADDFDHPAWAWMHRLPPSHDGLDQAWTWRTLHAELIMEASEKRRLQGRSPQVSIELPREQQRFIRKLRHLIDSTDLGDAPWLLFGHLASRVERYLAGDSIPTDESCRKLARRLDRFIPDLSYWEVSDLLIDTATVARAARARDRRLARQDRNSSKRAP
ncbi:hypothetical protein [Streptomyces chrestomyceticus]|uniref:hypothetical protein n=1 Tax=Streptomyces chrestomyceticus TaxID=68185 RepID=UPI0033EBE29B